MGKPAKNRLMTPFPLPVDEFALVVCFFGWFFLLFLGSSMEASANVMVVIFCISFT